jgi:hypothetical protein
VAHQIKKVSLERVAKEKLGKQKVKNIDLIELEIWENVEPGLFVEVNNRTIKLRLNYIVSTKKFLVWSGGIVTAIGGAITVLKWLLPILVAYSANPAP